MENTQSVQMPGGSFNVRHDHYELFWKEAERQVWEPGTFSAMKFLIDPTWTFLDVGAWMGPMSLYAAALGAKVISFEPDPVAYERLSANVAANSLLKDRITIFNAAAALADGEITLFADAQGNSETSIFQKRERAAGLMVNAGEAIVVKAISLPILLRQLVPATASLFVKIDIEGAEFDLLPPIIEQIMDRPRAAIHVSTHSFNIVNDDPRAQATLRDEAKKKVLDPLRKYYWRRPGGDHSIIDGNAEADFRLTKRDAPDEVFVTNFS